MYLFKNYDIKDWLIFNELFSVPMRVGKYKPGASPKEIAALKNAVFNMAVDAAAVFPIALSLNLSNPHVAETREYFHSSRNFAIRP